MSYLDKLLEGVEVEWKTLGELTQGKLVYEPVGYAPFSAQIKTETHPNSAFNIKVEQKTSQLASIHSRFFAKLIAFIKSLFNR